MPIEGLPQLPEVWFWSGDRVFLLREVPTTREGVPYVRMYLILTEAVKWRYGILDNQLNTDITTHGGGAYIQEYPRAHIVKRSLNPESPVIIMTCNFDGTSSFGDDLADINNRLKKMEELVNSKEAENAALAEKLKIAHQRLRALGDST